MCTEEQFRIFDLEAKTTLYSTFPDLERKFPRNLQNTVNSFVNNTFYQSRESFDQKIWLKIHVLRVFV